ncbi:MAG: 30S ribosomal protein S12 methylthiotransferase RimO [Clostridia bacterium]|nr:30S ribosomal protein S12 methylthiotransferase RimO [Clostridia bacterium]
MTKVGFVSLGCPKNLLDTEVMLGHLASNGYEITPYEIEADIIVINTCAFIESAKKESIDNILDIAWLKENRNLKGIVVTGCLSERYREEILKELPEVDAVLGTGSIHSIVKAVQEVEKGKKYTEFKDKNSVELGGDRIVTSGDAFAYLKISEGCNNVCTYCAIPYIRGKFRSRPMDELIEEAKELCSMGIKELIVIGQDTTAYGIDLYGEYKLHTLLSRLAKETDIQWLRILYCYPDKITDELIKEFKENEKLVKYIDLPIQHINSRILKKMNRRGDSELIRSVIKKLREIEGMSIRSTAIVGFPTETEEEFTELCEFVREAKFDNFGAFPYSREEGTVAYSFDGQIDEQVKQDRYDIIMREQLYVTEEKSKSYIGKTVTVLCEGFDSASDSYFGRTYASAPEIDGKVFFFSNRKHDVGEMVEVEVVDAFDYDLTGKAL